MSNKKYGFIGRTSLFLATIIWGTSFVVLKNTLDSVPVLWVLAIRFTGAAIFLFLTALKKVHKIDKGYIKSGIAMGLFLFLAYTFQTYGLAYTTPGKNAFLTAVYCVLVPFFAWAFFKTKPNIYNIIAAVLCVAGVGAVSVTGDMSIGIGDGLTLFCSIFFGIHVIITSKATEGRDVSLLTMLQMAVAAVLTWISAFILEPQAPVFSTGAVVSIAYLSIMCTAICYFLQTLGQKYTPPAQAAIILSFESVFGTIISAIFYPDEKLSFRIVLGFVLILLAVITSETRLEFLQGLKKKKKS